MSPFCIHNPRSPAQASERRGAFTIVEMLVAMSVLALMIVMVAQLTNGAAATVTQSRKHMDADSQARLIFGRMALEFSNMVKRTDVDYSSFKGPGNTQVGNDHFAFYSAGVGYYSGDPTKFAGNDRSAISLVAYDMLLDSSRGVAVLQRLSKAMGWEPDPAGSWQSMSYLPATVQGRWPNLFMGDADYASVGDQVFRIEYTYLLKPNVADPANVKPARLSVTPWDTTAIPPHTSIDGFKDVAAVVVVIAVLDSSSRVIVNPTNLPDLANAFPDARDGSDIKTSWVAVINSPNFAATAKIPQAAASAVRVYQRYFLVGG